MNLDIRKIDRGEGQIAKYQQFYNVNPGEKSGITRSYK